MKVEYAFLMSVFFIMLGISLFFCGVHAVDLATHYFKSGTFNDFGEMTMIGRTSTIDGMYSEGLIDLFFGFGLFGAGMYAFGIGIASLKKDVKDI